MNPRDITAIIGGTFNPVHTGHLRLAIEVSEALEAPVQLVPCSLPPHKPAEMLLPFDLRVALLSSAIQGVPRLSINDLEKERSGPSYTWDTLLALNRNRPPSGRLFFCLGFEDFLHLDSWYRGLELPALADIIVIPRGENTREDFFAAVRAFWPASHERLASGPFSCGAALASGGAVHLLPVPRLQISSSMIRERWRCGKSLAGLVPDAVRAQMRQRQEVLDACWKPKNPSRPEGQ